MTHLEVGTKKMVRLSKQLGCWVLQGGE